MVFFGVPHLGLKAGRLKELTQGQANNQFIHDLEVDDEQEPTPYLRNLNDRFIRAFNRHKPQMSVVSFFELVKTHTVDVC